MFVSACAAPPDRALINAASRGQFGVARDLLNERVGTPTGRPTHKNDLLDRMRLAVVTIDDGYTEPADPVVTRVYDLLTQQGFNEDKTVTSVIINEDIKVWKGEPYEQALMLHYVATHWAAQGSWDNARAAISRSLFHLRDRTVDTGDIDTKAVLREAYRAERRAAGLPEHQGNQPEDLPDRGYVTRKSNFALGYLMNGLANVQLSVQTGDHNRRLEAEDNFREAAQINPDLNTLATRLLDTDSYNTLLVVGVGLAPQKIATGPDGAIASYSPMTPSADGPLTVQGPNGTLTLPQVCDLNAMAFDHRWNHLQDARQIKSGVGTVLVGAGAATAAYGLDRGDEAAAIAGAGMILAGAFAKAGAHADTRYLEVLPQRVYIVPLQLHRATDRVELTVPGPFRPMRMVVTGIKPAPAGSPAVLRHVRITSPDPYAPWPTSGNVLYSNDATGETSLPDAGPNLPYILGGRCVRQPTADVLASYQRDGNLLNWTLADLREAYRAEGIQFDWRAADGKLGKHVLEGGRWLVAPPPGTTGFARLFGQVHPPYRPRSSALRELRSSKPHGSASR